MTGALVGIGYKAVRALIFHPEAWVIAVPILAVTAVAYGVEKQPRRHRPRAGRGRRTPLRTKNETFR